VNPTQLFQTHTFRWDEDEALDTFRVSRFGDAFVAVGSSLAASSTQNLLSSCCQWSKLDDSVVRVE
jgi:hypothetical protein